MQSTPVAFVANPQNVPRAPFPAVYPRPVAMAMAMATAEPVAQPVHDPKLAQLMAKVPGVTHEDAKNALKENDGHVGKAINRLTA